MASKKLRPPAATGDLGNCHRQAASDKSEIYQPFIGNSRSARRLARAPLSTVRHARRGCRGNRLQHWRREMKTLLPGSYVENHQNPRWKDYPLGRRAYIARSIRFEACLVWRRIRTRLVDRV